MQLSCLSFLLVVFALDLCRLICAILNLQVVHHVCFPITVLRCLVSSVTEGVGGDEICSRSTTIDDVKREHPGVSVFPAAYLASCPRLTASLALNPVPLSVLLVCLSSSVIVITIGYRPLQFGPIEAGKISFFLPCVYEAVWTTSVPLQQEGWY